MTLKSKIDELNGPAARATIDGEWSEREKLAFNVGFGRAKSLCAQLAIPADVQIEQLRAILRRIIASADKPGSQDDTRDGYVIVQASLVKEARGLMK